MPNPKVTWRTAIRSAASIAEKPTVKDSLVLSIKELFDEGLIEERALRTGLLSWSNVKTFQFHGTIRYEADLREPEKASLRLQYELDGVQMDYCVPLDFIEQFWGGRGRWFFRCPLQQIRVTKLYLPPGARRFASRDAHKLSYWDKRWAKRYKQRHQS